MLSEIKPCPFCGQGPRESFEWNPCCAYVGCINEDCYSRPDVEVMAKMVENPGDTPTFRPKQAEATQEARIRWNTRAPSEGQPKGETPQYVGRWEENDYRIGSRLMGFIGLDSGGWFTSCDEDQELRYTLELAKSHVEQKAAEFVKALGGRVVAPPAEVGDEELDAIVIRLRGNGPEDWSQTPVEFGHYVARAVRDLMLSQIAEAERRGIVKGLTDGELATIARQVETNFGHHGEHFKLMQMGFNVLAAYKLKTKEAR